MRVRPLSRDEVRSIDARCRDDFAIPTLILMENAGRGATEWLRDRLATSPPPASGDRPLVVIACGPGNNGGDGAVVARHLDAWGIEVRLVWFAARDRLQGDAATQREILRRCPIDAVEVTDDATDDQLDSLWRDADWLVDGLLGTGLTRPVDGLLGRAITSMNRSGRPILALDIPSGLDADSGQALGAAIQADATATFVAPKLGFARLGADTHTGQVVVIDIGAPRAALAPFLIAD